MILIIDILVVLWLLLKKAIFIPFDVFHVF